jgi:hypothetical protein
VTWEDWATTTTTTTTTTTDPVTWEDWESHTTTTTTTDPVAETHTWEDWESTSTPSAATYTWVAPTAYSSSPVSPTTSAPVWAYTGAANKGSAAGAGAIALAGLAMLL